MSKITLSKAGAALYKTLVKSGEISVFTGSAKYVLVEALVAEPIPMDMVSLEAESRRGKAYEYGEMIRINTDEPVLSSTDFPFAYGEKQKFEDANGITVGIYRLKENLLNADGSVKVPAGRHTLRVACL